MRWGLERMVCRRSGENLRVWGCRRCLKVLSQGEERIEYDGLE